MAGIDLLCFGEPLFELSNVMEDEWRSGIGGDVSNVAIAAARQGARSAMLSQLGDDAFGAKIREIWRTEGVKDAFVSSLSEAQTGLYFITHENGEHHFEYRREDSAASLIGPEDIPDAAFENVPILHFSGITQAISASSREAADEAIRKVKGKGGRVSYDPNLRLKLWPLEKARQVINDTVQSIDILLPGLDDARILTGLNDPREIIKHYAELGPEIVALTMGDQGVLVSFDGMIEQISSPKVDAVDASGAGDCFDGAFLSQLIAGSSVPDAAAYAAAAAALSVTGHGATKPIPRREAVLTLLKEIGGE